MLSNDSVVLNPRTTFDGPALTFDFPGLKIGVAEYDEGPTGCTVFRFAKGVQTATDIRGGSAATINFPYNNAICLAGGSLYGLEAATGAAAELLAQGDYSVAFEHIAAVSGAIAYDFGGRDNSIYPDKSLGRAAIRTAREGIFPQGRRGVGRMTHCGLHDSETSGQGGAFRQVGRTRIAVFTVVNAIGAVVNRQGQVVKGNRDPLTGVRRHYIDIAEQAALQPRPGNTTLTLVVTDQTLAMRDLTQLGRQVHTSLARVIQPFHTLYDGDVLFACSTDAVNNADLDIITLGVFASELAWDAVLQAVAY